MAWMISSVLPFMLKARKHAFIQLNVGEKKIPTWKYL